MDGDRWRICGGPIRGHQHIGQSDHSAEHAFGLMLMLARKLDKLDGLVTVERIKAAHGAFKPYQRAHTPGGNYARLGGTRALNGATMTLAPGELVVFSAGAPQASIASVRALWASEGWSLRERTSTVTRDDSPAAAMALAYGSGPSVQRRT